LSSFVLKSDLSDRTLREVRAHFTAVTGRRDISRGGRRQVDFNLP
jgi:hypothetical protein